MGFQLGNSVHEILGRYGNGSIRRRTDSESEVVPEACRPNSPTEVRRESLGIFDQYREEVATGVWRSRRLPHLVSITNRDVGWPKQFEEETQLLLNNLRGEPLFRRHDTL